MYLKNRSNVFQTCSLLIFQVFESPKMEFFLDFSASRFWKCAVTLCYSAVSSRSASYFVSRQVIADETLILECDKKWRLLLTSALVVV